MPRKEYTNPWLYDGKIYDGENINDYSGFVYIIENLTNGKKYIGKKAFWVKRFGAVKIGGNERRKKQGKIVESAWRHYYGSSDILLNDIKDLGEENFCRTILRLCETRKEMSYWELHEQVSRNVLISEEYYNSNILGKFWPRDVGEVVNG